MPNEGVRKIGAGIVGTGFIGGAHIEAARRLPNVDFIGVAEADASIAEQKAKQHGLRKHYADADELLKDDDIQVVHNCTPNHLHHGVSKKIIEAGKHVISEKPLGLDSKETAELLELAEKKGVVHAIDFNYRYYPLVQQAKAMVEKGEVGDIFHATGSYTQDWLFLNTDWNWRLQPELSDQSRAVADVGSHWMDAVQFISGRTIVKVYARFSTVHPERMKPKKEVETYSGKMLKPEDYEAQKINTEDFANVLFEFDNGAIGSYTVSQVFAGRKNRLFYELAGSKCSLVWDQERSEELWIGHREKPNYLLQKDPALLHPEAQAYCFYPGGHPEAYPDGLKNFLWRVYSHIAEPRPQVDFSTFADGHHEAKLVDAILESARGGKWVKVE
jgi:predicted dehydrogenase